MRTILIIRRPVWAVLAALMCLVVLCVPGCGTDSAQRVALLEDAVGQINAASVQLDQRIADVNSVVSAAREVMADPNIPLEAAGKLAVQLGDAQAKAKELLAVKADADAILVNLEQQLAAVQAGGAVDISDELGLAAATLAATGQATGGKAGAYMGLAATLLGVIAGVVTTLRKAKRAESATREIVMGLDDAKRADTFNAGTLKTAMNAAQSVETRAIVAKIRGAA